MWMILSISMALASGCLHQIYTHKKGNFGSIVSSNGKHLLCTINDRANHMDCSSNGKHHLSIIHDRANHMGRSSKDGC